MCIRDSQWGCPAPSVRGILPGREFPEPGYRRQRPGTVSGENDFSPAWGGMYHREYKGRGAGWNHFSRQWAGPARLTAWASRINFARKNRGPELFTPVFYSFAYILCQYKDRISSKAIFRFGCDGLPIYFRVIVILNTFRMYLDRSERNAYNIIIPKVCYWKRWAHGTK